jgi:hypothetical protein
MRRIGMATAAAAALVGLLGIGMPAGGAPTGEMPPDLSGDQAPGGSVIATGSMCVGFDQQDTQIPGTVSVTVFGGDPVVVVGSGGGNATLPDGDWTVEVELSDDAVPGETYTVQASCTRLLGGDGPGTFNYPVATFVMGEAQEPEPEPEQEPEPEPAPAPLPTDAAPTFTG